MDELNRYKDRCKILEERLLARAPGEQSSIVDLRSESEDDDEQEESIRSGPSTPDI